MVGTAAAAYWVNEHEHKKKIDENSGLAFSTQQGWLGCKHRTGVSINATTNK